MKLSIQMRFNLIAAAVVVVVLILFGIYNQSETRAALQKSLNRQAQSTMSRITNSIPVMLWNYETEQARKVVESELASEAIRAVYVYDNEKIIFGLKSDPDGELTDVSEPEVAEEDLLTAPLEFDDSGNIETVGRVSIEIDSSSMEDLLNSAFFREVIQTILLLAILVSTITLLMRQVVIRPLFDVGNALKDIAQGEGDLTQRLKAGHDEVGILSGHFNIFVGKIQDLLKQVIESMHGMNSLTAELREVSQNTSAGVSQQNV